jgi:hypothetical protein
MERAITSKTGESSKAGTSSANDENPAKRQKIEDVPSEFPNLKIVRLHKTYLEVGDLFANTNLGCLEILIDERRSFEEREKRRYRKWDVRRIHIEQTRTSNPDQLIPLLKLLPNLITLRLCWSENYEIEDVPEELNFMVSSRWRSFFDRCSKVHVGLPQIQNLEIYNFDNTQEEVFINFISNFSGTIKTLMFKNCEISTTVFLRALEKLKLLEKIAAHIITSDEDYGEVLPFVHEKLQQLDVHFESSIDQDSLQQILASVSSIKDLKSNIASKNIQEMVKQGNFPNLLAFWQSTHVQQKPCKICNDIDDNYSDYDDFESEEHDYGLR